MTVEDVRAFRLRDTVRLLDRHGDIPAGTIGRVIGWFVQHDPTYVVYFDGERGRVAELRADEIVLADLN